MNGLEAWKNETFNNAPPAAAATVPSAPALNQEAFQQRQQQQEDELEQLQGMSSSDLDALLDKHLGPLPPTDPPSDNTIKVTVIEPTSDTMMTDAMPYHHAVR